MLLMYGSFTLKLEKGFNLVVKFLNEMEQSWVSDQKKLKL